MWLGKKILAASSTTIRAMSSAAPTRSLIAVCQMTCDNDLQENFNTARKMIERAGERNCKMVFLPECFDFVGKSKDEQITLAMDADCEYMEKYRELARKHKLWLSLGGLHHKDVDSAKRPWNTHLVIDDSGVTQAEYHKLHLFDLEIPGKVRLMESEFSKAGIQMVPPVETPVGKLGLSICYDMRFPELSIWNRKRGAQILSFPSAFTLNTGLAHWEALLRARAIENQCYVVAAAQTGKNNEKRLSYGHSMVVDPWGAVVAQCSERVDMCFAEIDLAYVDEIRTMQPVYSHRRDDLYTLHVNEHDSDQSPMKFSTFPIHPEAIFYRSRHSFAFVNLKPVLNGHVLISPKSGVRRLTDLTDEETADLFIVAKKVQAMLEKVHKVTSSTICVQDGKEAGQTVPHVHVHILARRPEDFGGNSDNLYNELSEHDKKADVKPRTQEEMAAEAKLYRSAMQV